MIGLKAHGRARVYPVGDETKAATGTVVLISENGNSIAISFGEEHVPFITGATGMAIHLEFGKMFLARRIEGVWSDAFDSDRKFEIEAV